MPRQPQLLQPQPSPVPPPPAQVHAGSVPHAHGAHSGDGCGFVLQLLGALLALLLEVPHQCSHLQQKADAFCESIGNHHPPIQPAAIQTSSRQPQQQREAVQAQAQHSTHLCGAVGLQQHAVCPCLQRLEHHPAGGAVGGCRQQRRPAVALKSSHQVFGWDDLRQCSAVQCSAVQCSAVDGRRGGRISTCWR